MLTAVSLTCVSLVLVSRSSPVGHLTEGRQRQKNRGKQLGSLSTNISHHKTNLSQTVSFAERLVGHVFKLLWDRTWTPSGWVVLDHRGVELGHGLRSERGGDQTGALKYVQTIRQPTHKQYTVLNAQGLSQ